MVINRSGSNPVGAKTKLTNFRADRLTNNGSVQPESHQLDQFSKVKATVAALARDSHPTVIG